MKSVILSGMMWVLIFASLGYGASAIVATSLATGVVCKGKLELDASGDWTVTCTKDGCAGACAESALAPGPGEYSHSWCACEGVAGEPPCCHLLIIYDENGNIQYGSADGFCKPRLGCPSGTCGAKQVGLPGGTMTWTGGCV